MGNIKLKFFYLKMVLCFGILFFWGGVCGWFFFKEKKLHVTMSV